VHVRSLWQVLRVTHSRLRRDRSGVSMVEFALVLPVLLTLGLFGTEVARLATTKMKVSQIALSLADNASRLGQTDNSTVTPTVSEDDVDAVISGALRQGLGIDFESNGRVILSSLEYDYDTGKQYIHWQRCQGDLDRDSSYGNDTDKNGINGPDIAGMGKGSTKITAQEGSAVMYVEVFYQYEPLFENSFGAGVREFREEAAFVIRDDRNLDPGLTGSNSDSSCS